MKICSNDVTPKSLLSLSLSFSLPLSLFVEITFSFCFLQQLLPPFSDYNQNPISNFLLGKQPFPKDGRILIIITLKNQHELDLFIIEC